MVYVLDTFHWPLLNRHQNIFRQQILLNSQPVSDQQRQKKQLFL